MTFIIIAIAAILISICAVVMLAGFMDSEANKNAVGVAMIACTSIIIATFLFAQKAVLFEKMMQEKEEWHKEWVETQLYELRSYQEQERYEKLWEKEQQNQL